MTPQLVEKHGENLYTHTVEIRLDTAAQGKFMLPDDSILRRERILALFVADNRDDSARSPLGYDLVSNTAVRSGYLTLKQGNEDILSDYPLSDLLVTENDKTIREVNLCDFTPSKSFVTFGNTSLLTDGESLLLHIVYEKIS